MDGGEQFLPEDEFLDQPGTSQAASSSRIHSEINVEETVAADNMYMTEDGMRYIGIDGEICYFEEEHIEVLDEPLDEVIVEGSENEAFEGEEAQPPPNNDEFKVVAPKIPADTEEVEPAGIMIQNIPQQGLRRKRTRQYGSCSCQECGQTFINQARLERHLVTHQVFGSFLCPLCGKVFKYEYNLFHHWRRACFELKEVMAVELRQDMEVNQLRMMVEDLAQKKPEIGPVELGISKSILFQTGPTARLEIPNNFQAISRRGNQCESCNVFIPSNHIRRHASLHQADSPFRPDDAMDLGGFICDLCGICYRFHHNLLSHWRSSCPEILANLPQGELCLDDEGLRDMVVELLVRAKPLPKDAPGDFLTGELSNHENSVPRSSRRGTMDDDEIVVDDDTYSLPQPSRSNMYNNRDTGIIFADDFGPDGVTVDGHGHIPSSERSKWRLKESAGKICSECGKIFANQGRLERHQMGTHSNFGSHQCILCGNRFKYEYNLLFHYRKSCPYTRAFIEESLRQQLNSNELRKIIRGIAQKKLPSKHTLPFPLPANMAIKGEATRAKKSERVCPPQSLHIRPDLSDREPKACPVCEVIFYGTNYLNRHIQTAHGMNPEELSSMQPAETRVKRYEKIDRHTATPQVVEEDDPDDLEPPPKLMPQIADKPEIFYRFVDQLGKRCSNISKEALDIIRDYLKSEGAEAPEVIIQTEDETKEYEVEIMGTFDSEDVKTVVLNVKSRFKNVDDADEKNEIVFEETVGEEIDEEPVSMEEIAV